MFPLLLLCPKILDCSTACCRSKRSRGFSIECSIHLASTTKIANASSSRKFPTSTCANVSPAFPPFPSLPSRFFFAQYFLTKAHGPLPCFDDKVSLGANRQRVVSGLGLVALAWIIRNNPKFLVDSLLPSAPPVQINTAIFLSLFSSRLFKFNLNCELLSSTRPPPHPHSSIRFLLFSSP